MCVYLYTLPGAALQVSFQKDWAKMRLIFPREGLLTKPLKPLPHV